METEMENEMETGIMQGIIGIRVSQNEEYHFGGPINKDYSNLGSILGSPFFGKLPNRVIEESRRHAIHGLGRAKMPSARVPTGPLPIEAHKLRLNAITPQHAGFWLLQ